MITGAHSIIYSTSSEADRAFLRDVMQFPSVDVGGGWLIFGLPPSEVAVHPGEKNDAHELYLMCDDVQAFVADMAGRGITTGEIKDQGWGVLTTVTLPGGGKLGVYEPRHARPAPVVVGKKASKKAGTKKADSKKAGAKKVDAKKSETKKADKAAKKAAKQQKKAANESGKNGSATKAKKPKKSR